MKKILSLAVLTIIFLNGFSQSGQNVFNESIIHEIRITFTDVNFWDSLTTHYDNYLNNGAPKTYMMGVVSIDGVQMDSVGIRQKGFFSNWGSGTSLKKPLKIDFKEFVNHKFDGLKKLNLANGYGDPTIMRDALAYHFFRKAGLPAPRTAYAKVYLNNTYWGLYCMVEQIDSEFLEDWYPNDPDGNLYKCINNTNLDWQGSNWNNYSDEFALKTNKTANINTRFIDFVNKVNNTPANNFKDSLNSILETDAYFSVLAGDVLMYNWDSYYEHGRNFYMYQKPLNNKFNWIPWDYNLAFSNTSTDIIVDYSGAMATPKPLVKKAQNDTQLRQKYFNRMCHMLNYFSLDSLESYIDITATKIRPALNLDPNKFFTIQNFDGAIINDITINGQWGLEQIPGLKSFISGRKSTVVGQLNTYGYNCGFGVGIEDEEKNELGWKIFPNPLYNKELTIKRSGDSGVEVGVVIYSALGELVYNKKHQFQNEIKIDLGAYRSGLYIVKISENNEFITKRVIKE